MGQELEYRVVCLQHYRKSIHWLISTGSIDYLETSLQALAKDDIFPYLEAFSVGHGKNNDPFRAYIAVFGISLICILIADLDFVSSLLSNFFIAAYALINFSVFHASVTNSPGWRPSFKYYNKWLSLLGTILCITVMFLIEKLTALATFLVIIILYLCVWYRKPNANWGSSTQVSEQYEGCKYKVFNNNRTQGIWIFIQPIVCSDLQIKISFLLNCATHNLLAIIYSVLKYLPFSS